MIKLIASLAAAALLVGGLAFAAVSPGSDPASNTVELATTGGRTTNDTGTTTLDDGAGTTTLDTTESGEDVSGPCDEAEHANDPRCTGNAPARRADRNDRAREPDVSGPCDEAEHANDPRCTGGAGENDDRGGREDDGDRDDRNEDRSGSNSGSDERGDEDDDGGHGGSGRSGSDDNSGSDD